MKEELLKSIAEGNNDLKERLKKVGAVEGKDYTISNDVESMDDCRYLDRNIKLLADSDDPIRDVIFDEFARFQYHRTNGMVEDMEVPNQYSSSEEITEDEYRILSKIGNLDSAISKILKNKDKGNANGSGAKKSKGSALPASNSESKTIEPGMLNETLGSKENNQVELNLTDVVSQPQRVRRSYVGCVRETLNNSDAQMQAIGVAAVTAAVTAGIITIKACCDAPRLDGESGLHKTKRVVKEMAKRPGTWLKIVGSSLLAYGASIGCQANKRMR